MQSKLADKKKLRSSSKVPEIIVLDEETSGPQYHVKTVDLTETEPELIVLDDTVNTLNQTISNLNASLEDIDLEIVGSFNSQRRSSNEDEVKIVSVQNSKKQIKPKNSILNRDVISVRSNVKLRRQKNKNVNGSDNLTININSLGLRSVKNKRKQSSSYRYSCSSQSSDQPKKKIKLRDLSNIPSSFTSTPKQLTGKIE